MNLPEAKIVRGRRRTFDEFMQSLSRDRCFSTACVVFMPANFFVLVASIGIRGDKASTFEALLAVLFFFLAVWMISSEILDVVNPDDLVNKLSGIRYVIRFVGSGIIVNQLVIGILIGILYISRISPWITMFIAWATLSVSLFFLFVGMKKPKTSKKAQNF